jgi:exosortase
MDSTPKATPSSYLLLAGLLPACLAMGWLVSKAQWFWRHRPDLQFGWIVLLLCAYLFWEAWETRPQPRCQASPGVFGLGCFGLALLFLVQIYQAAFGTSAATIQGLALGVLLIVAANLRYLFGWRGVRHFAMAFAFVYVALPLPSAVQHLVVGGLQAKVAAVDVQLLNLMGVAATRVGSLIQLPTCTVGIDEACSGIRSLQSTVMATLFIGYLTLQRNSLRVILFGSGVALALLGNVVRSLFLSVVANSRGIGAIKEYHDTAGWSILAFTVVGVGVFAWLLARLEKRLLALSAPPSVPPP